MVARLLPVSTPARGGPKQYVGLAFGLWARVRNRVDFGPGLGFTTERLCDLDLSNAFPDEPPSEDLIDRHAAAQSRDSGPTERLRIANQWAAALETHLVRAGHHSKPPATVHTTYGFVRLARHVQLSVIHYLPPIKAFGAARPKPIELMGWRFPVVVRPWLPTEHGGAEPLDANCWVKFTDDAGVQQPGVLTARHALKPMPAALGQRVSLDVKRSVPNGQLKYESEKMDAAVISVGKREWKGRLPVQHSSVVGYKPIRLVTHLGPVEADIVEHSGFLGATFFGVPGKEPLNAAFMIFNKGLDHGDSGCLGWDREFTDLRPYLMYLGVTNYGQGRLGGYGLFIAQAVRVWNVQCCMTR